MEAKKNDLVVVTTRGRAKVARYVSPAPVGSEHLVTIGDGVEDKAGELKLVDGIYTLDRQPA